MGAAPVGLELGLGVGPGDVLGAGDAVGLGEPLGAGELLGLLLAVGVGVADDDAEADAVGDGVAEAVGDGEVVRRGACRLFRPRDEAADGDAPSAGSGRWRFLAPFAPLPALPADVPRYGFSCFW